MGFARNCTSARGVHCETVKGLLVQANDDFFFEKRSKSCSADKVQQRAKGFSGLQCSGSLANQCYSLLCYGVQCYSLLCYMAVFSVTVLSVTVLKCSLTWQKNREHLSWVNRVEVCIMIR